jgi:prevent-host-death family protein
MESVGSSKAKTRLSALIKRVEAGESIIITKHGRAIARLVPFDGSQPEMTREEAIAGLLEFQKKHSIDAWLPKDLIQEGRKY